MITGKDIYEVVSALVPLYAAMILAYGSVRWWHIFTPDQCSGINRFVAVFAVPLLSFHFISANNPYAMNYRFIAADSLQKAVILAALSLWHNLISRRQGDLDWTITLFSLSTLPNTLVMGIPLLTAMYGDSTAPLMVQIVVMQSVVWYTTLMLFMFEYRGAKSLIAEQFPPGVAGSIASLRVESDVVSLNGREPLQADAEVGSDGKIHVVVRRSAASSSSHNKQYSMDSGRLAGVEIYSAQSSPTASRFNEAELYTMFSGKSLDEEMGMRLAKLKVDGSRSAAAFMNGGHASNYPVFMAPKRKLSSDNPSKDLHMYVWSSSASPESEANLRNIAVNTASRADDLDSSNSKALSQHESNVSKGLHVRGNGEQEIIEDHIGLKSPNIPVMRLPFLAEKKVVEGSGQQMPPSSVVTRLILIMVWRKLIRNPNTYSSLLGLVWSLLSFRFDIKMPKIVQGSISILSNAGLGMAMFSLGLFMALQPKMINCGKSVAIFAMAVRFLAGPAVIAATSIAIGIRGVLLKVAIVQAALPQGIVPFVFAKEYSCHPDILSTAVIFGMLVALPVTIIYYILLGLCIH